RGGARCPGFLAAGRWGARRGAGHSDPALFDPPLAPPLPRQRRRRLDRPVRLPGTHFPAPAEMPRPRPAWNASPQWSGSPLGGSSVPSLRIRSEDLRCGEGPAQKGLDRLSANPTPPTRRDQLASSQIFERLLVDVEKVKRQGRREAVWQVFRWRMEHKSPCSYGYCLI